MPAITRQRRLRTGELGFTATTAEDEDQYICVVDSHITKAAFAELFIAYTPPGGPANPIPRGTLKTLGGGLLICDKISCRQMANQSYIWHVTVNWKNLEDDQPQQQGFPTANTSLDPNDWAPAWSRRPVTVFEKAVRAFYKGGYVTGIATTWLTNQATVDPPNDGRAPIVNSALQPFAETPEHRRRYNVWNLRFLRGVVPSALMTAEGKINSEDFAVTLGYAHTWKAKTALIDSVNLSSTKWGAATLIEINIEIIHDPQGWEWLIADRGTARRAQVGDPNERGVTISGPMAAGKAKVTQLVDQNGRAIQDPVYLDGDGQPLAASGNIVYGRWSDFAETGFDSVPLVTTIGS